MAKTRTIYLQLDKVLEEVFVLGTELVMDIYHVAPPGAKSFSLSASVDVTCWVSTPFRSAANDARGRVAVGTQVHAQVLTPSQEVGDKKMSVTFYGEKADVALAKARVYLTAIGLSLDVDSDRDGIVEQNHPNKATWKWGPNGHGAILLVNCDKERDSTPKPDNEDRYLQGAAGARSPLHELKIDKLNRVKLRCWLQKELTGYDHRVINELTGDDRCVTNELTGDDHRVTELTGDNHCVTNELMGDDRYAAACDHPPTDLQDMSPMLVRTRGPAKLPPGYSLQLHSLESQHAGVFYVPGERPIDPTEHCATVAKRYLSKVIGTESHSLGPGKSSYLFEYPGRGGEVNLFVEGLSFPDGDFNGFVHFHLSLLQSILPLWVRLFCDAIVLFSRFCQGKQSTPIFTDSVVFRVAPWIMTPNTQPALEVFMSRVDSNAVFIKQMTTLAHLAGCTPIEIQVKMDVWMQDEMEFGYCECPTKVIPVVFDSPRDRELKAVPILLTGKDFGYVTRKTRRGEWVNSLDSFGNLEVSPPVIVRGKKYPLGRIIIGSAFPGERAGRKMARAVREFLFAQQVQAPVELYSDWLSVGHVDEFMSFVPAPDRKGFRLLLASPNACLRLLKELHQQGHGQRRLFESCPDVVSSLERKMKIQDILDDINITTENNNVQRCIDWNRDVLKRELGLEEADIIDLPVLFFLNESKAEAYFPDVVNMVVLNKELAIPKPFGPIIDEQCALETSMCSLLEPLGLRCSFVDDLLSHHVKKGEVHCGSNTRRAHFAAMHWWDVGPGLWLIRFGENVMRPHARL
ncbi:protein-arginine deiminase type-2-like [Petromyzon marinus]|uniref:protein-arginine deiminase type-2-like n=1 Tax=Petromyzon marinus TaxID=7757 RepID=UPI003F6F0EE4